MAYGLTAFEAGVGHQSVTRLRDALLACHPCCEGEHLGSQRRIRLRDGRHISMVIGGDHEDMHGSLRLDVTEGEGAVGARDDVRGDLARNDATEEAIGHAVILT
jgi:hypothetical protein